MRDRYNYTVTGEVSAPLKAALSTVANTMVGQATTITAVANPCFPGATYQWNFGSGYTSPSTSLTSSPHTYSTAGDQPVNLKVTDASGVSFAYSTLTIYTV